MVTVYKKKYLLILLAFTFFLAAGSIKASAAEKQVSAQEYGAFVADDADLFDEKQMKALNQRAVELSQKSGFNVIVATIGDAQGKDARTVGEEYYNAYALGDNGITCLIDMDNREIWLVTAGSAINYLTDKRIDSIIDDAYGLVSDQEYEESLMQMMNGVEKYYKRGVPDNQKIYDADTGEVTVNRRLTLMELLLALGVGIGAAAITAGSIYGKYRLKFHTSNYDFHKSGHLNLTREEDRFVNEIVTHHHIERDEEGSGSGGNTSTVHSGSGGRSFGGGGRKF